MVNKMMMISNNQLPKKILINFQMKWTSKTQMMYKINFLNHYSKMNQILIKNVDLMNYMNHKMRMKTKVKKKRMKKKLDLKTNMDQVKMKIMMDWNNKQAIKNFLGKKKLRKEKMMRVRSMKTMTSKMMYLRNKENRSYSNNKTSKNKNKRIKFFI